MGTLIRENPISKYELLSCDNSGTHNIYKGTYGANYKSTLYRLQNFSPGILYDIIWPHTSTIDDYDPIQNLNH